MQPALPPGKRDTRCVSITLCKAAHRVPLQLDLLYFFVGAKMRGRFRVKQTWAWSKPCHVRLTPRYTYSLDFLYRRSLPLTLSLSLFLLSEPATNYFQFKKTRVINNASMFSGQKKLKKLSCGLMQKFFRDQNYPVNLNIIIKVRV